MIENVKIFSKIAAKTFVSWFLVVAVGTIISFAFFLIILFEISGNAGGGHGNVVAFLAGLFADNKTAFILFVGAPVFVILYFLIANKYATESAIYQIWKAKAENFVGEGVKKLTDRLLANVKTVDSISNESLLKVKLLDENRKNPETSRLKRNLISYIIKKIRLDDIDFSDKEVKLSDVVATKVNNFISENSEPSLKFFWILLIVQIVLFIISQF